MAVPRVSALPNPNRILKQARTGRHGYKSGDETRGRGVVFYRDDAHWCPYCEKVQLLLEEKNVPYKVMTVPMMCYASGPKPDWFLEIQPNGMLPAAVVDSRRLGTSDEIMFYVEERYRDVPMLPVADSEVARRIPKLLRLEREFFSAWVRWLTTRGRGFANNLQRGFEDTLARVERELPDPSTSQSAFFLGDAFRAGQPSFIDCTFAPFLERASASLAYNKAFKIRGRGDGRYPRLERWFKAMEAVPAYQALMADAYSHAYSLPPQLGGCPVDTEELAREVEDAGAAAVNTREGNVSWRIPLRRLTERDVDYSVFMQDEDMCESRRNAAEALEVNLEAVAKFATRGCTRRNASSQRYGYAPLADPGAPETPAAVTPVKIALEAVVTAMKSSTAQQFDEFPYFEQGKEPAVTARVAMQPVIQAMDVHNASRDDVLASLTYLSKRIGVPRDMGFKEARQLRAHLVWAITGLERN